MPTVVQKTIAEQTKTAKLVGVSREREHGQTVYEVETTSYGKSRDLMVSATGIILSIEEEVGLDTLPSAVKSAIEKRVGGGTIKKVELVTQGDKKSYEAAYVTKAGRHAELGVNSDGSVHK